MRRALIIIAMAIASGAIAHPAIPSTCDQLAALKLPDTTVSSASVVPLGAFTPPANVLSGRGNQNPFATLPAFCRVIATVKPASDSNVGIEVWLPVTNWNGKFQASGGASGANSAIGGSINFAAMAASLRAGFATAGTDNGHASATLSFAPGHPEKLIDFGYRATHEMTVKAKALVEAFYGSGPKYSYWNACAAGGRQGLQEAQRYPSDYDGIVVVAPANNWSRLQSWSMWLYQVANKKEAGIIPAAKYPAIHKAVVEQCDELDGVKDGIIENPARCHVRLEALACQGAETNQCLTPAQIQTAKDIYAPMTDPQTGRTLYPPMPPGSELGWAALAGTNPPYYASETFKYLVFNDSSWNPATRPINPGTDVALADTSAAPITAANPDLAAFFSRGGKIIQYHGWTDPLIAPGDSIDYYNSVRAKLRGRVGDENFRLFMVPGMNHCQGGEGTDTINAQAAMEAWVEHGHVPSMLIGSKVVNGEVVRTHPLCPYPQEAVYKGSGNSNDAMNFTCRVR